MLRANQIHSLTREAGQVLAAKIPSTKTISLSLSDLVGSQYTNAVCAACAFLEGADPRELATIAEQKVDFFPDSFARRLDELLPLVGRPVTDPLAGSARGAGTKGFRDASRTAPAPLSGLGLFRIGEDGRLYLASKAEHYHLSVGHAFPGYRLLAHARRLGIPNCTHNNTRGHITRLLEQELVAAANGIPPGAGAEIDKALESSDPRVINRVINLETGSLAVEAALKLTLARFYRFEPGHDAPACEGRIPVLLVIGDYEGGTGANYHGTTTLTQVMRGLWPELGGKLETSGAMLVRPVKINDIGDFKAVLGQWDSGPYKVAAFFHEIVLMNYGALRLERDYLARAYDLCRARDVTVIADEIQSCIWSPDFFLFREYGLQPDIVSVGKGCPGGEYPAARVLSTSALDSLPQFGALVTNGQEEIASLAFLVTMAFARANRDVIAGVGEYYEQQLSALAGRHAGVVQKIEGRRHLASLFFRDKGRLSRFVSMLNGDGIDISVQSYKASCPPSCLTKLPLIATAKTVDFIAARMVAALKAL
jgi:acetylornithine/succinyldiaminopimelate/putrescine aminotransferase